MARGRKRKAGRRHPSGKLVQPGKAETQREATATVLEARQRHYGVTARQAKDERLGTALGPCGADLLVPSVQGLAGLDADRDLEHGSPRLVALLEGLQEASITLSEQLGLRFFSHSVLRQTYAT